MSGFDAVQAYKIAYAKALDIHRQWQDLDPAELLLLQDELRQHADEAIAVVGQEWARSSDFERHLNFMKTNLTLGRKDSSQSDIDDLVYADFPAMLDHILRKFPKSRS